MKKIILFILLLTLILLAYQCKSTSGANDGQTGQKNTANNSNSQSSNTQEEFINPKEGFISDSIFQVVVYSFSVNPSEAKSEAKENAQKKSYNLMLSLVKPGITNQGKNELKDLIQNHGRIVKSSEKIDGKFYYIYQVEKPSLETLVKQKIN